MREQNPQQPPGGDDDSNLDGKLKKRLWIAGGLVTVALAAIPIMDSLNKPKVEMTAADSQSPSSGKIIKAAPSAASEPATQAAEPASAPHAQSSAPQAEAGAPAAPSTAAPSAPDLSKTPAVASHPAPRAAQPAAAPRPAQAPAPVRSNAKAAAEPAPDYEAPPAAPAPASKAFKPSATPNPVGEKAKPAGSSVGYQVQLGLFASIGNAEKLVKQLQQHGIKAHTVTRVQLGPFQTRAEADEAMSKLRALGYSPLLAPAGQ